MNYMNKPEHYKGALGEVDLYFTMRLLFKLSDEQPDTFNWLKGVLGRLGNNTATSEDVFQILGIGCEMARAGGLQLDANEIFEKVDFRTLQLFMLATTNAIIKGMVVDSDRDASEAVVDLTLEKARAEEDPNP